MTEQLFSTLDGGTAIGSLAVINAQLSDFLRPLIQALITLAGLAAGFFVATVGLKYMASRRNPQRLNDAKRTLKNAALELFLAPAAAALLNPLSAACGSGAIEEARVDLYDLNGRTV